MKGRFLIGSDEWYENRRRINRESSERFRSRNRLKINEERRKTYDPKKRHERYIQLKRRETE